MEERHNYINWWADSSNSSSGIITTGSALFRGITVVLWTLQQPPPLSLAQQQQQQQQHVGGELKVLYIHVWVIEGWLLWRAAASHCRIEGQGRTSDDDDDFDGNYFVHREWGVCLFWERSRSFSLRNHSDLFLTAAVATSRGRTTRRCICVQDSWYG